MRRAKLPMRTERGKLCRKNTVNKSMLVAWKTAAMTSGDDHAACTNGATSGGNLRA